MALYTIGRAQAYDRGLRDAAPGTFRKVGRGILKDGRPYAGGSVWKTPQEAMRYLKAEGTRLAGYAVYTVEGDWNSDVDETTGERFGRLIVTRLIVGKWAAPATLATHAHARED